MDVGIDDMALWPMQYPNLMHTLVLGNEFNPILSRNCMDNYGQNRDPVIGQNRFNASCGRGVNRWFGRAHEGQLTYVGSSRGDFRPVVVWAMMALFQYSVVKGE